MAEGTKYSADDRIRTDKAIAEGLASGWRRGADMEPSASSNQAARTTRPAGDPASAGRLADLEKGAMRFAETTVVDAAAVLGGAVLGTVGAARQVVDGTLDAVTGVGGHAVSSAEVLAGGLLRGAANVGGEAASVVGGALRGAVGVGAEAANVAGGILRGAAGFGAEAATGVASAGREAGTVAGGAVRDLAVGAVGVADVVGQSAVRTATGLLVGVVAGLKEVLATALPSEKGGRAPIRTDDRAAASRAPEKTL